MADAKGPDGWEAEEYDREKIRELRDEGLDPASVQEKLKSIGHPSARDLGTDERQGDEEVPVSGDGPGEPQLPGGEGHDMAVRGGPTGGTDKPLSEVSTEEE